MPSHTPVAVAAFPSSSARCSTEKVVRREQAKQGRSVVDLICRTGVAKLTLYCWRQQYGRLVSARAREFKQIIKVPAGCGLQARRLLGRPNPGTVYGRLLHLWQAEKARAPSNKARISLLFPHGLRTDLRSIGKREFMISLGTKDRNSETTYSRPSSHRAEANKHRSGVDRTRRIDGLSVSQPSHGQLPKCFGTASNMSWKRRSRFGRFPMRGMSAGRPVKGCGSKDGARSRTVRSVCLRKMPQYMM